MSKLLLLFVVFYDIICLNGFTIYQDGYNFQSFNWYDANDYCLFHHGNTLASIKNENEMNVLHPHLMTWHVYQGVYEAYFWIGLKRNSNNQWEWVDGTPFGGYQPWRDGEGSNTNEKCGQYLKHYAWGKYWRDQDCNGYSRFGFICNDGSTTELFCVYIYLIYVVMCYILYICVIM